MDESADLEDRRQRLARHRQLTAQREEVEQRRQATAEEVAQGQARLAVWPKHQQPAARLAETARVNSLKDEVTRLRTQKRLIAQELTYLEKENRHHAFMLPATEQALLGAAKLMKRWKLAGVVFRGEEEQVYTQVQEEAARLARVQRMDQGRKRAP